MDNKYKTNPTKEERENMSLDDRKLFFRTRGALSILEGVKLITQSHELSLQEVLLALEAKDNQDDGFFVDKSDKLLELSNINIDILKSLSSNMRCTTTELIQILKDLNKEDDEII